MAVGTKASERMHGITEAVSEQLGSASDVARRLRSDWETTERRAMELVDRYPLACFIGAVVGGYVLGRLATRAWA